MTVIRAAAVQLSPVLYSREKTVEKIVGKIAELRSHKVQFATFPEAIVPYYPYFTFLQPPFKLAAEHLRLMDQAVTIPSPATDALGEAARQAGIVVSIGVNEETVAACSTPSCCSTPTARSSSAGERPRRPITNASSGGRATGGA